MSSHYAGSPVFRFILTGVFLDTQLDQSVIDYVHTRKFPVLGRIAKWGLRAATAGVMVGVYQFNTNDIGESSVLRTYILSFLLFLSFRIGNPSGWFTLDFHCLHHSFTTPSPLVSKYRCVGLTTIIYIITNFAFLSFRFDRVDQENLACVSRRSRWSPSCVDLVRCNTRAPSLVPYRCPEYVYML